MKTCTKCNKEKELNEFQLKYTGSDSRRADCRLCKHDQTRKNRLQQEYNLTLEEYDEMLEVQNGLCFICGKIEVNGRRLAVDHNHLTGKVRKLLCSNCNTALGKFGENISILKSAIEYLELFNGTE